MVGKVSLVGAGSGDPDLLTVRALRLIRQAEVVVYDHLVGRQVLELIPAHTRRVYAGKESGNHALPQEEINALLVELGQEGWQVVRLKGGDPFIFGRGGEEMEALEAAGVPFEIVPGITSAATVGACLGIPLTHRAHACSLILTTGHLKEGRLDLDWSMLAHPHQTVVIYMGLAALPTISRELLAHGLPASTPALVVQSASLPDQRTVAAPVGELAEAVAAAGLRSPALVLVGAVAGLYRPEREAALKAWLSTVSVANNEVAELVLP